MAVDAAPPLSLDQQFEDLPDIVPPMAKRHSVTIGPTRDALHLHAFSRIAPASPTLKADTPHEDDDRSKMEVYTRMLTKILDDEAVPSCAPIPKKRYTLASTGSHVHKEFKGREREQFSLTLAHQLSFDSGVTSPKRKRDDAHAASEPLVTGIVVPRPPSPPTELALMHATKASSQVTSADPKPWTLATPEVVDPLKSPALDENEAYTPSYYGHAGILDGAYVEPYPAVQQPFFAYMDPMMASWQPATHMQPHGGATYYPQYYDHQHGLGVSAPMSPPLSPPMTPVAPPPYMSATMMGPANMHAYQALPIPWAPTPAPAAPFDAISLPAGLGAPVASPQSVWQLPPPPLTPQAVAPVEAPPKPYLAMAIEKDGSHSLQQQLARMRDSQVAQVLSELSPHMLELAKHQYGNYLVSALAALPMARPALLAAFKGRVVELMQHPQGCRVVQKTLERLSPSDAALLVHELRGHVVRVACSKEGKYSVIVAFKVTHAPFIMTEVVEALPTLSVTRNGSLFLQRLLDPDHKLLPAPVLPGAPIEAADALHHGGDAAPVLDALLRLGGAKVEALASDQYANFVVKLALLDGGAARRNELVAMLMPRLAALSATQWGSHVAKVVVSVASHNQLAEAREVLTASRVALRSHEYGSFVMCALERKWGSAPVSPAA